MIANGEASAKLRNSQHDCLNLGERNYTMYHFPGEYVTDFCIVQREGVYHLFHIRGERWTWPVGYREIDLGHATSTDLRTWTPHAPVLPAGPAGMWDESGNWAPDIFESAGVYYCFYTGSDKNNNQAIGLATSTDLFHWQKHPNNPVVKPGPWSDHTLGRDVACRDAMVYHDAARNRYLLYYTATMADGRACLALAQSRDLIHWEDRGPTYIEISDDPTGGWVKPVNHTLLEKWTCASEHPTFAGIIYMFYIIQEEIEGIWGASVLSDPKRLAWTPDGTVQIREHVPDNVQQQTLFDSNADNFTGWVQHGGEWRAASGEVRLPQGEQDVFLMDTLWGRDLTLGADMFAEQGVVASLIVRSNPSAMAGYRISLDFDRGVVGFYLRFPGQADRILQERQIALSAGEWHKLKVVAQGKFFEIYVDDNLLIVHDQRVYEDGCFGLHARGAIRFRHVYAYTVNDSGKDRQDWHRRCQPRHLFPSLR